MIKLNKICALTSLFFAASMGYSANIFVSPRGNGDGKSYSSPMSLKSAVMALKKLTPRMTEDINIILQKGRYVLRDTITLTEKESGKNGHKVIFKAAPGAKPIISGGAAIKNWKGPDANGIYSADVPKGVKPRMLLAGGKMLERAKFPNIQNDGVFYFKLPGYSETEEGNEWSQYCYPFDKRNERIDIGRQGQFLRKNPYKTQLSGDELEVAKKEGQVATKPYNFVKMFKQLRSPGDVEINIFNKFRTRYIRIDKIVKDGHHQWIHPIKNHIPDQFYADRLLEANSPFHFENAYEFIDLPNEWCFDSQKNKIYLKCHKKPASVFAGQLKNLLVVNGASNITFDGMIFQNTSFDRVTEHGFQTRLGSLMRIAYKDGKKSSLAQSEPFLRENQIEKYRERSICPYHWSPGAVEIRKSQNFTFSNNIFRHTGGNGVVLIESTKNITFSGNVFYEIADTAILVDALQDPKPDPGREVVDTYIRNNLFSKMGTQFRGGMAIFAAFPIRAVIEHNDFYNMESFVINMGWGFDTYHHTLTDNVIKANYFKNVLSWGEDMGVIHTKSSPRKGVHTVITENVIDGIDTSFYFKYYAFHATRGHNQVFYIDDGSNHITIKNNVLKNCMKMKQINPIYNIGREKHALLRKKRKQPPFVGYNVFEKCKRRDKTIEANAGLTEDYKYLRKPLYTSQ